MLGSNRISADVEKWFEEGHEEKIERLLLEGRSYLLEGKEASNQKIINFMRELPIYKVCDNQKKPTVVRDCRPTSNVYWRLFAMETSVWSANSYIIRIV